ncbi:MAG: hypothetical protein ACKPGK_09195, partial [Verrucomicrobiota bacterium]
PLPSGADNQPNLYLRIISDFAPGTGSYSASQLGSTYSSSGPIRYDNLLLHVPEPATSAAVTDIKLVAFALLRKRLSGKSS